MLDEKSLRKPSFDEANSCPVVLADGQQWFLRRPLVCIKPEFKGGRAVAARERITLDGSSELEKLRERSKASAKVREDDEGEDSFLSLVLSMAAMLLAPNYNLTDEQYGEILSFDVGTDDRYSFVPDIIGIVDGAGPPKGRSAPGGNAPS